MIERVAKLLDRCGGRTSVMPPTELYNDGWLLRVALDWFSTDGPSDSQFSLTPGAAWYSEGRLASPFLARFRSDKKADLVTKESIEGKVRRRAVRFGGGAMEWIDKTFMPYFPPLKVGLVSWEQINAEMGAGSFASEYDRFYEICCSFVPRLRSAT